MSQSTSLIVGQSEGSTYEAVRGRDECLFAIQVRRLIYSYSERKHVVCVLNRLSMRVPLGQIYGLLGPSGCGKTTLIRCVLGILRPEAGQIRLFHRSVDSSNVRTPQIPGRDVGYMPQEYALYGSLTVLETVRFHRALHDRTVDAFAEFKLLDLMQLGPLSERRVDTLSGGQTRRLSFVCALVLAL
jgi:ABC-type multidrug transport system ATPase subunit